ncbi:lipase (class 3) [Metarhizium robertsii]|uniref:Triacylglycerol lipase n=2 Tax=Metarhizium robertsii TaxID=568076 RepID=E9F4S5_METRA|nr:triacylglycerol lipase [Metarhizium robertsii ARSEF 23]EFY97257.1 triacylglycerol lipase [Metarhizium robertsii ARSEF 23]EXV00728.1 lipase (class 3) [Metarhizium robertsii]
MWSWALLIQPLLWWRLAHSSQHHVIDSPSPNSESSPSSISTSLFADLERLSRLVDVSYCIGSTGVHKPFQCLSRCKEFPGLSLAMTWSTGFLMGDSCGYIAVDHGSKRRENQDGGVSGERNGAIIVAFRGTYSIANTVVDLGTIPQEYVPYPAPDDDDSDFLENYRRKCDNCTVHMGFLHSWRMARGTVVPELKALRKKYPSYKIQLVGHSLGGAVACLAALELKLSLGWDNLVVTTFGEPRVGNYQLARYIDKAFQLDGTTNLEHRAYRRVTHNNDPVPLLPLEEWGYSPHGGEIYISKQELQPTEEDIRSCVGDSDPECSAGAETSLLEDMRRLLHFASASPSIEEYIVARTLPTRLKIWQLFFAHRDYFWRLGLCVPGGDPANWGRGWSGGIESEEL